MPLSKLRNLDATSLASNPRASLAAWSRYAPVVQAALAEFPKTFAYECEALAPATIVSRIRDAIRGCLAFDYPNTVPVDELSTWFDSVRFWCDEKHLYIGQERSEEDVLLLKVRPVGTYNFDSLSIEDLSAFITLLSHGRILGPIVLKTKPPALPPIPPNVETITKPDGSFILL